MNDEKYNAIIEELERWKEHQIEDCKAPNRRGQGPMNNAYDSGYILGIKHTIRRIKLRVLPEKNDLDTALANETKPNEKKTTRGA